MNKSGAVMIRFIGFCSKKNRKAPNKNGRGLHLEPKTRLMLERMELQVPAEARDRMLEHPESEWFFTFTNARVDRDGIITSVLDILQKYGVIKNDSIAWFNGKMTVHAAVRSDQDTVTVVLIPTSPETPV